jgi:hypothetical protein
MKGVSRIAGEGLGADGVRRPLYEALRELICSSCGAAIPEGARFTRHGAAAGREAIHPRCAKCAPHEPVETKRSALLESLLGSDGDERRDAAPEAARRAVEKRLGPALARSHRRRGGE